MDFPQSKPSSKDRRYLGKHRGSNLARTVLAAIAVGTVGFSAITATTTAAPLTDPVETVANASDRPNDDRADRGDEREEETTTAPEKEKEEEKKPEPKDAKEPEKKPDWVSPSPAEISDVYGPRAWRAGEMHFGLDFAANEGEPNYAAAAGVVVQAGPNGGYGNSVIIDHGKGVLTVYGHHSKLKVSVGDKVKPGDVVGLAGSTGDVTGPHLHFEVNDNGTMVDPHEWLTDHGVDL
ncbi:M23 family metallopeptidase [Stackebrandtia soli]|uniref:M23 family metallopeptidase n=1 Tax=Stackebrandtia soli TaxID=1892856 RepID=UPI0039EACB75